MGTEAKKPAMQMTNLGKTRTCFLRYLRDFSMHLKHSLFFLAVDHTDPKVIAQQVANSLVQRYSNLFIFKSFSLDVPLKEVY